MVPSILWSQAGAWSTSLGNSKCPINPLWALLHTQTSCEDQKRFITASGIMLRDSWLSSDLKSHFLKDIWLMKILVSELKVQLAMQWLSFYIFFNPFSFIPVMLQCASPIYESSGPDLVSIQSQSCISFKKVTKYFLWIEGMLFENILVRSTEMEVQKSVIHCLRTFPSLNDWKREWKFMIHFVMILKASQTP